ncbi:tripartite tricarboxylate transporter substrate binding protein [Bordetella sp. BOR01]|uniref:Bug family tripartite tricarboxylate transporter substrate binding protein n=1 Tax=Bordetella sp. BOR01 TaxID=2854779 RepID=UPI001C4725F6|nr:tripartite tricarboxylate transporter substrate binding protein [Bordetella sp. BOR01]MBV7486560.1 tripartite tricarboxylate transporter substrate binding protein [Bordetella sp. BOR01]
MKIAPAAWRAAFCAVLGVGIAQAQTFPAKPIELTILWAAGTAPDVVGRALGEGMARQLGQPVLAVNKPGAGGAVAYRYVANQPPDGYALIMNSNSISTAYHSGTLPFDYHAFTPIAQVSIESPILVARADAPYSNLVELLAYARQHPGDLKVGNSGVGSHLQIASESFFEQQRVEVAHIPFASSISITNLLGGYIDASMTLPGSVAPHVAAGTLKVLGVLAAQRDPTFPQVPTAIEQGYDFKADMWRGVAAPKGLPDDVRARLEQAIRATVESEDFKRRGLQNGFQPVFLEHAAFDQTIAKEDAVIATALDKLGLKKSQ